MSKTRVKICGIKTLKEIEIVNQFDIDYIGFVFTKSKREITIQKAQELKKSLDISKNLKIVGVFKNNSLESIKEAVKSKTIDIIQLHGDENTKFIKSIKSFTNIPIIKAINLDEKDFTIYENLVDYFLFDGKNPGSGEVFDWSKIPQTTKKIFLAGGIAKENVKEAIKKISPYALDLSSSLEIDNIKSYDKIKEFLEEVKSIDKAS